MVQFDQDVSETAEPCGTSLEGANKDISPPPSWGGNWERGGRSGSVTSKQRGQVGSWDTGRPQKRGLG